MKINIPLLFKILMVTALTLQHSCKSYRVIEVNNTGDYGCTLLFDYNEITDSELKKALQKTLTDSILIDRKRRLRFLVSGPRSRGWTEEEYYNINGSVKNIILRSNIDTLDIVNAGFYYAPATIRSYPNRKITLTCPVAYLYQHQANNSYFPLHTFRDTSSNNGYDRLANNYYSSYLRNMDEPILHNTNSDKVIIRFLWLRSFHSPIAVRLEKTKGENYNLVGRIMTGPRGFGPLVVKGGSYLTITDDQTNDIDKLVSACGLQNMQTVDGKAVKSRSHWIFELKDESKDLYHVVERQSPQEGDCIYSLGQYLLQLSRFTDIEPMY